MEIQKREGVQKLYWNPREVWLPPSGPSLTSYALEYVGALRMIRVSAFSNDLMPLGG